MTGCKLNGFAGPAAGCVSGSLEIEIVVVFSPPRHPCPSVRAGISLGSSVVIVERPLNSVRLIHPIWRGAVAWLHANPNPRRPGAQICGGVRK
jgi:hypothetical protein